MGMPRKSIQAVAERCRRAGVSTGEALGQQNQAGQLLKSPVKLLFEPDITTAIGLQVRTRRCRRASTGLVSFVVRVVVRSGVDSCGTCGRGAKRRMAKLLVEAR